MDYFLDVVLLFAGFVIGWLARSSKKDPENKQEVERLVNKIISLTSELAEIKAKAGEQEKYYQEKTEALLKIKEEIEAKLQTIADKALLDNQGKFIELANEILSKHKKNADSDLDNRKQAIESMLKPAFDILSEYRKSVDDMEKERQKAYGSLSSELQNVINTQKEVKNETAKLVNALRSAPKTRGRWGEETLKNVMEMSGMSQYCDFRVEESFDRDDKKLRPDVIINLPGGRHIVVDAKTSLSAYMDAMEAETDKDVDDYLRQHASQIRMHVKQLSSKAYWDGLTVTPEFVAMFIPGENFFAAALEKDPNLLEEAISAKVLIVTPTTLIALAKAIAFGWRQEKVAENALKVASLGKDLYKRLSIMGNHIAGIGSEIDKTVKKYNAFVGSLEANVMPQARKFVDLEIEGSSQEIDEIPIIDTDIREVRKDRDLLFLKDADK
ncbi:MAG: DNA recombination protein RmuC [Alphaproteobacteria bacterium]